MTNRQRTSSAARCDRSGAADQLAFANRVRTASDDPAPVCEAGLQAAGLVALGCLALALGLLVYLADRDPSQSLLIPAVAALAGSDWFGPIGQWLPSLVHALAFSLFTAAALPPRSPWRYRACAVWCAVNLAFELGQHPRLSAPLAEGLQAGFGDTRLSRTLANYFLRGTFDVADIVAVVLGALAAAAVLRLLQGTSEKHHAY